MDVFDLRDDLGPAKVIHVHEPGLNLRGILVVDNVARGPAIGGMRMAPDVSLSECFRLARAMSMKNAAAGLAHGGGKSVLFGDPRMPGAQKEALVRAFAHALRNEADYIFGPDMGTDETCMAWVKDEIGRSVGLPAALGGIPLDEIGATGWGVCQAAEVAAAFCEIDLKGARVAVQGFGAVGKHAARFLAEKGALLVAASDTGGTVTDPNGLYIEELAALKAAGKSVVEYRAGVKHGVDAVLDAPCEIWIPAARPDVVREDNQARLQAKLVLQGANVPFTEDNSMFAGDPWLFNVKFDLAAPSVLLDPLDPIRDDRLVACEKHYSGDNLNARICWLASAGHPNPKGSKQYVAAIQSVLGRRRRRTH